VNGGASWMPLPSFPPPGALVFAFTPDGSRVFAGTPAGVYVSDDGGASWAPRSAGLPAGAVVSELIVDPVSTCRMYAGLGYYGDGAFYPGGIYQTLDGGASWTRISNDRESSVPVTSMRIDPSEPSRLIVATYGQGVLVLPRPLAGGGPCP
jgi:photosystem II stability/assembly factor-like uncharacterized protein